MLQEFDANVKTLFTLSTNKPVRINHHLHNRDDANLRLKRGYPILTVSVSSVFSYVITFLASNVICNRREEMLSFFQPALDNISASIRTQFQSAKGTIAVRSSFFFCVK